MATIDVLDVRRVGQISGTTGYRWPHLVDPVGNPLLVDTGRWNVHGVDLGANAKHSDGRLYIFFGDVGTNMSNHPPQDSDLVAWTDPELLWHGGHLAMGWNFTVPVTVGQPGQPNWRFCRKCSVLYFAGEGFDGKCSRGGAHSPAGLNFTMAFEPTSVEGQHQWHRCKKCSILFYWEDEGDPLTSGRCPAGGTHVRVDWRYVLPVTEAGSDGQPDWRFCANCHGLFWDGAASKGICSGAGGGGIHLHGVLDGDGKVFDPFTGPEPIGYLGRDETPNGAFSFDGTMYVFAGFPEPQYSHRNRGGEPLGGQYLFSKRDPSVPGRYKLEFRLSPKLGWCTLDAARTTVDAHFVMGFRFVVSHSIAPSVSRSTGWQLCSKCQAIYFSGFQGVCWYGGGHVPVDSTDYGFEIGDFDDVQNQSHFHRCVKCQSLFWSAPSDPNTGFCPDGGNHDSDGLELRVPHTSVERTPMRQPDWRFCMKCFTLFFQWPPEKTRCPKDQGQHKPAGFNFQIPVIVGSVAGTEPYWLMCKKCRSMFFEDGQSRCPRGGGPHDAAESKFPLSSGLPETLERESDWRECRKCAGLFFDGFVDKGSCPSDGLGHEKVVFGANYSLEHNPGADDHNRDGFRYCVRCHGLVLADQPARVPWVAPVVVNTADHAVIPGNSGQALVMIGYDWKAFRLLYMPLTPGETPRLHHVRYYDAGARLQPWSQEPTHDEKFTFALFKHRHADEGINYTHVSAAWLPDAGYWVVLYAASGGKDKPGRPIIARLSKDLTEWSDEVEVFDPLAQNAFGTFMHEAGQHDGIDRMPPRNGALDESGWAYGAFIIEPFTRFDRESRQLRLVYLMSTSNPYQVHVMQTVLRLPP